MTEEKKSYHKRRGMSEKILDVMSDKNWYTVPYSKCLEVVDKMIHVEKELNPKLISRNITSLCVKHDILTDEKKAKYTVWEKST